MFKNKKQNGNERCLSRSRGFQLFGRWYKMRLNATAYVHRSTEQDRPYFKNDGKMFRDIPSVDLNKQKVCDRFVSNALFKN